MIKTFRGLMADDTQDTIVLHTNDGSTGYRIVKLDIMGHNPGSDDVEGLIKIYKTEQSSIDGVVDFSDNTLLGAAYWKEDAGGIYPQSESIIFDQEIFNQDIFVTHKDVATGKKTNYYLELEQVKLDLSESTVATLKDVRNVTDPVTIA